MIDTVYVIINTSTNESIVAKTEDLATEISQRWPELNGATVQISQVVTGTDQVVWTKEIGRRKATKPMLSVLRPGERKDMSWRVTHCKGLFEECYYHESHTRDDVRNSYAKRNGVPIQQTRARRAKNIKG